MQIAYISALCFRHLYELLMLAFQYSNQAGHSNQALMGHGMANFNFRPVSKCLVTMALMYLLSDSSNQYHLEI